MEGQDQQGSVITINRKALLHSVQLAAERNLQHEDDASETSIVNGESSTSEESGTSNAQQTIVLKAEHVQRAQKRRREAKKLDKPTKPIEHPVAPMRATITHERTENGRHSLRPKVQTVATENFSSDEFGDEGSDDDFRGSVAKVRVTESYLSLTDMVTRTLTRTRTPLLRRSGGRLQPRRRSSCHRRRSPSLSFSVRQ
eukprot:TRINITY_DN2697_c0_g1_i7.p1 TRINITY_DN2697_c0_g1~~TRINITY_DN2697_c0_g1_i7.p1  ORF type:complete len:199 (-),score=26.94 TRINITY_DN2697_c0_g1_i7:501-1097(-)